MKNLLNSGLRRGLVWLGILGVALAPASAATATTKTTQAGNVKAELSYQKANTDFTQFNNLRLKITRAGKTLLDQPLPDSEGNWPLVALGTDWAKQNAQDTFRVRNLDANPEPEVLVDLFTGGAHCCTYSLIYRYNPKTQTYNYERYEWGNGSYELQDLDNNGVPEFKGRNDAFAYAFTSYAASGYPIQIWQYRQGKLVDVTRQYPKVIYDDAYYWWQTFQEHKNDGVEYGKGPLAAYLADKYLLGQGQDGWQRVQQAYKGPDRQKYFTELRRFLRETGYISGKTR
ncbi:MAG: hypothetical protein KME12_13360 [Trichocoleus desertorum ATA4-8-CV12]|jgi:hypothetical protein|nr:hypothetical protein [Trichocoleus desertorum ATA4-8-CV12]